MDENEPTYQSFTIWKDQASFQKWRQGSAFQKAHGGANKEDKDKDEKPVAPPAPLWVKPPQPVFYQGTLVISSQEGA